VTRAPFFTVVVPLYNKRRYVRRCAESVLRQTHRDLRLVVVDDGSTDGSALEVERLRDDRLTLVRQPNGGEGSARNAGIARADGEWIAFLDADDLWLPNHLEELRSVVERCPAAGLVSTDHFVCEEGSAVPAPQAGPAAISEIDYFRRAASRIGIVCASTAAVRASALGEAGGFGPFVAGADLEMWARLALHHRVAVSSRRTAVYFRGNSGTMETLAARPCAARRIEALADVSPSVAFLAAALAAGACGAKGPSVVAYVNSRIRQAVKSALHRGDVPAARRAAALFVPPLSPSEAAFRAALALPAFLVAAGVNLVRGAGGRG
jgi:glycosyltransferase involved in cell wall biosynthesis